MIKAISRFIDILDILLNPSQKKLLKRIVGNKLVKKLQGINNESGSIYNIDELRYKFLSLGFIERGYKDLLSILNTTKSERIRRMAARELALWHANQYTKDDAIKCLKYLELITYNNRETNLILQASIMKAECLKLLERKHEAKIVIDQAISLQTHADCLLAAANLASNEEEKLRWINRVFQLHQLAEISFKQMHNVSLYDRMTHTKVRRKQISDPKVTVIMPVFNAERFIGTALDSVLSQTWANIEVLVVDDCSSDSTIQIVREYEKRDPRVRLIQSEVNGGPYVARNLALREATGEFVTCHDGDDWSHPEKLEKQVTHLIENEKVIGNMSEQARATSDLIFYRRGRFGSYVFSNMSSFMFRRVPVIKTIGYWDSVRFGADSEFIRRIKLRFGDKAVVQLSTGPLSFQRQSCGSLTGHSEFGYHGYFMGARKEYFDTYIDYHESGKSLKYDFPQKIRPFAVPEPMWPMREKRTGERRHFNFVIVSDFRLETRLGLSIIEEIIKNQKLGARIGLVQMNRYSVNYKLRMDTKIRDLLNGNIIQMLVYGEKISCDFLILLSPTLLQEKQSYIPNIKAKQVCVIVDEPPISRFGTRSRNNYEIFSCTQNLIGYFGVEGIWYPISPIVRKSLLTHHEVQNIQLAEEDWTVDKCLFF